jgi:hypothetical protein
MRRRVPSLRRIEQLIGWRPRRDLQTILRDVADYCRARGPEV